MSFKVHVSLLFFLVFLIAFFMRQKENMEKINNVEMSFIAYVRH